MNSNDQNDKTTEKGGQPGVQDKPDEARLKTVTPDNDNGEPGPPAAKENKQQAGASEDERK